MTVYRIDPLSDARWPEFLARRDDAGAFHAPAWLEALRRTYGYEPVVYTTTQPGDALNNGIAFCRVDSRLTGRRLVSLPFSDHCQPLIDDAESWREIAAELNREIEERQWRYVELRPMSPNARDDRFGSNEAYFCHRIDLTPDIETIEANIHKKSIRAMIRRAEKEDFQYEKGRSPELLDAFFRLQVLTRRKHSLPPQPRVWFENLVRCFGEELEFHAMSQDGRPVAGILTIHFNGGVFWKYGCSDAQLDRFGVTRNLLWAAIRDGKERGACYFDMGRSEPANEGLVKFKDRWGGERTELKYWRMPPPGAQGEGEGWKMRLAKKVFAAMPEPLFVASGRLLYRHMG